MLRHFDPVTLRLFIAVCEERNIARAAAREALVASAVSKRVSALERELGAPLLVRARRGVVPTAAGAALLRHAREVLGAMERMHAEISEFAAGVQGNVRVLASVSALAERLPEDIAVFLARHRAVRVSLDEVISGEIVRQVREGAADVGVLWDAADLSGLQVASYRSDHLCVVLPAGHPLARNETLSFRQTLDYPSVGVAVGGTLESLLRRESALLGRTRNNRIQVSGLDAAPRIVAAGLGLAVLPREAAEPSVRAAGLRMIPLAESWALRHFAICTRPERMLSAATRLLVEHLSQQGEHAPG